jgi:hypothetical protein
MTQCSIANNNKIQQKIKKNTEKKELVLDKNRTNHPYTLNKPIKSSGNSVGDNSPC